MNKCFDLYTTDEIERYLKKIDDIESQRKLVERIEKTNFLELGRQRRLIDRSERNLGRYLTYPTRDSRKDLSKLQNPIYELRNPLNDIDKSFKLLENMKTAERSINRALLRNLQDFKSSSIQNTQRLIDAKFSFISRNNLIGKKSKDDLERIRENLVRTFHSKTSKSLRVFEQSKRAIMLSNIEVLSKTFLEKDFPINEKLTKQVSSSLLSYDRFANDTLTRLNFDKDQSTAFALKGSLTLASKQILRSTSAFLSFVEGSNLATFDESSLISDREFPKVNRYRIQRQELLRRDDIQEDEEYESLVTKSESAISFEQISNCMTLVGLCNEASETTKGYPIFKVTSTVWLSAWKLTGVVPTNRDKFGIIVDCLYLMLYEGAGKDKLRFIEQGYIETKEAEVIWKIKHLRNKWLRHDIDHGKESDIRKSYLYRKEALEWFGLEKVPYSKEEFIFLYNSLMLKVEEFLKLLLERVSKFSI